MLWCYWLDDRKGRNACSDNSQTFVFGHQPTWSDSGKVGRLKRSRKCFEDAGEIKSGPRGVVSNWVMSASVTWWPGSSRPVIMCRISSWLSTSRVIATRMNMSPLSITDRELNSSRHTWDTCQITCIDFIDQSQTHQTSQTNHKYTLDFIDQSQTCQTSQTNHKHRDFLDQSQIHTKSHQPITNRLHRPITNTR